MKTYHSVGEETVSKLNIVHYICWAYVQTTLHCNVTLTLKNSYLSHTMSKFHEVKCISLMKLLIFGNLFPETFGRH